jgi:hypothetical protein
VVCSVRISEERSTRAAAFGPGAAIEAELRKQRFRSACMLDPRLALSKKSDIMTSRFEVEGLLQALYAASVVSLN